MVSEATKEKAESSLFEKELDNFSIDDEEEMDNVTSDESETLSDIDDVEVNGYIYNEKEQQYKKIIWEAMNNEYLEKQTDKKAYGAKFQGFSEELLAKTADAVANSRKERQRQRNEEAKKVAPSKTAAEPSLEMLTKKRLSSKINYDILEKLNDDSTDLENTKKKRVKSVTSAHQVENKVKEPESDHVDNVDNNLQEDEYGYDGYDGFNGYDGYNGYIDESYNQNEEEEFGYYEDVD